MKLGAQLYTVRELCQNENDLASTLATVAEIGYHTVQISGVNAEIPAETVRRLCDDNGLEIVVTHTAPNKILEAVDQVIADHKILGASYVGLGMMPKSYLGFDMATGSTDPVRVPTQEDTRRFIADFTPSIEKIAAAGLKFVYHNHHFEFARQNGKSIFDQLIEGLNPQQVDFLLDTFWIQFGGADVLAWINRLSGRLPVVHFKDLAIYSNLELATPSGGGLSFSSPIGSMQMMAPIGSGNMNFPGIIETCKAAGTQHVMVEQDICQGSPLEALRSSYNYLKSIGLS